MASTYGKLLLTVYELEGLLLVLEKHGADTPASVIELIKEKAASVAQQAECVQFPEQPMEEEMLEAALDASDEDPEPEPEPSVDEGEEPPHFVKCPGCGKVLPATYSFCNECGTTLGEASEPEEPAEEPEAPAEEPDVPIDEDAEFLDPAPLNVYPEDDYNPVEEEFEEVETEEEEEIEDDEPYDDRPLSVQEKLNREMAKNLRSSFSFNDSIRFRRELFGNSQAEYNDALDMILTMHSFGEAEEYFYDDLGWDPMNEDVKAYMEVVRNFFS